MCLLCRKNDSTDNGNCRFICAYNVESTSMVGDRLKPPPSVINPDRKVIKLGKPVTNTELSSPSHPTTHTTKSGIVKLKPSTGSLDNIQIKTIVPKTSNGTSEKEKVVPTESSTVTSDSTVKVKKTSSGVTLTTITPLASEVRPMKMKLNRTSFPACAASLKSPSTPSPAPPTPTMDVDKETQSKSLQQVYNKMYQTLIPNV